MKTRIPQNKAHLNFNAILYCLKKGCVKMGTYLQNNKGRKTTFSKSHIVIFNSKAAIDSTTAPQCRTKTDFMVKNNTQRMKPISIFLRC